MKPEELLMQYYQYWTQPTDGPAHIKPPEDHEGTIEALRIGAEAISERDALKDETQQVRRFLRGCMNHAFDETPLVQVARDVSGEFHRNRYQIQQRNTQINEMREERDAMKAEVERLRKSQCHHGWRGTHSESISTPCPTCGCKSLFIGSGGHLTCSRVPSDTGKGCDQPSVERAFEIIKAENERLRAENARLNTQLNNIHRAQGETHCKSISPVDAFAELKQRIAELEAELQANALTIDARNIRFAELREPTNTEETES